MSAPARPVLTRSQDGHTVHVTSCRSVRRSPKAFIAWLWSLDQTSKDVAVACTTTDIHACRLCKPITALAWWEHEIKRSATGDAR